MSSDISGKVVCVWMVTREQREMVIIRQSGWEQGRNFKDKGNNT